MLRPLLCLAALLAPAAALAQAPPIQAAVITLAGTARTGADTRPVELRLSCSHNGQRERFVSVLAVELWVPQADGLPGFALSPFEGPDARAGALSQLQSAPEAGAGRAPASFAAAGWYAGSPSSTFVFAINLTRTDAARLRQLSAVLKPATEGPGRLLWRQGNARRGGAPIEVSAAISAAEAGGLGVALSPCLLP